MDDSAILIAPEGMVTTPSLGLLSGNGHPADRYVHVLDLLGFAGPFEITFAGPCGLVVWVDYHAYVRRSGLNLTASIAVVKTFGAPLPTIYAPAIVTGGCSCDPQALTDEQVVDTLDLLDLTAEDEIWS